jgi:hypothetical protein
MKKILSLPSLFTLLFSTHLAFAGGCDATKRTFQGDSAKALISALKLAGVPATETPVSPINNKGHEAATNKTYSLAGLSCAVTRGGVFADGLDRYACVTIPGYPVMNEANAEVLSDALSDMGIFPDSGMSKSVLEATGVDCEISVGDSFAYACTLTSVWADTCQP